MREFYVSRQSYWHEDGAYAVEIARELDYSGPGALGAKYPGEGCEYLDPREAAQAAISVREAWLADLAAKHDSRDGAMREVALTLAMNDLVYPVTDDGLEPAELIEWADKRAESMAHCEHCGLPCESDGYSDYGEPFSACDSDCAERYVESLREPDYDDADDESFASIIVDGRWRAIDGYADDGTPILSENQFPTPTDESEA